MVLPFTNKPETFRFLSVKIFSTLAFNSKFTPREVAKETIPSIT